MLRANIGLSRKLTKDYQSSGFSVNIEGELTAPTSDAEAVIEQIKELYDLAEEALDQQIERSRSVEAIAARDTDRRTPAPTTNGHTAPSDRHTSNGSTGSEPAATPKQINFLLTIGKRQRLSTETLEAKIAEVLGRKVGLYDLTKQQAGIVLDALSGNKREQPLGSHQF